MTIQKIKNKIFIWFILLFALIGISENSFAKANNFSIRFYEDGEFSYEEEMYLNLNGQDENGEMIEERKYTGHYISVCSDVLNMDDLKYFSIKGDIFAKEVGKYEIIGSLRDKNNTTWSDGTTDDKTLFRWEIYDEQNDNSRIKIKYDKIISLPWEYGKNVNAAIYCFSQRNLKNYVDISGTYEATEIDSYTFTASLKDKENTCWIDNTTEDVTINWKIRPCSVKTPELLVDKLQYNGKSQNIIIKNFDSSKMEIISGNSGTNIGKYSVTIGLKDKEHYVWKSNNSNEDLVFEWNIVEN